MTIVTMLKMKKKYPDKFEISERELWMIWDYMEYRPDLEQQVREAVKKLNPDGKLTKKLLSELNFTPE